MNSLFSADVAFPVLMCIPNGSVVSAFGSPVEMVDQAYLLKIRSKGRKFKLISDDFGVYKIINFKIVGSAGPFFGLRFGWPLLFTRYVRFDPELSLVGKLSLDELIDLLCKDLEYDARAVKDFRERFSQQMSTKPRSASVAYELFKCLALELYADYRNKKEQLGRK